MANCTECKERRAEKKKELETMYVAVHESDMARTVHQHNKENVWKWIVIILLIVLLVGTNTAWLVYESQFETVSVEQDIKQDVQQDTENGSNSFIGGDYYGNSENTTDNTHNDNIPRP